MKRSDTKVVNAFEHSRGQIQIFDRCFGPEWWEKGIRRIVEFSGHFSRSGNSTQVVKEGLRT